jgi:hypothetical protein
MKRALILIPVLALGGYAFATRAPAPCTEPILYSVGTIDPRFGVSQANFLAAVTQAGDVWSKVEGKELFAYDPKGSLKMNLIYDARQATTDKNKVLESKIATTKQSADSVKAEYSNLESHYAGAESAYKSLLASYTAHQNAYNTEVNYWNNKGGAPTAEFNKLSKDKSNLDLEAATLEDKRQEVNNLAGQINALIKQYNYLVDTANINVKTINQTAGQEFDEGEYISDSDGKRVNIYEFTTTKELKRVLSHELGHALGLDHNSNPNSIMYYLNQSTNTLPTKDDVASLNTICGPK